MRDDLRRAPVHRRVGRPARQDVRSETCRRASARSTASLQARCRARRRRDRRHRRDRAGAAGSPAGRGGIAVRNGASASRAYDPRRNAGQEVLGEERSERLILPRLNVARRPVVEQAIAGDMVAPPRRSGSASRARCRGRSTCRARARNRGAGSGHIRAPRRRAPCAARRGGPPARPTAAPSSPARDSRSAHICSWEAADCRAGTSFPTLVA